MNNLTTRKIVLGLLIAFVLAFGVQGIVDAQTIRKGNGDIQVKNPGDTFTISFSVSGVTFDTNGDAIETVSVGSGSALTIKKVTKDVTVAADTAFNLSGTSDPKLTNTSYTITYEIDTAAAAAGQKDITVSDQTFTIYVVPDSDITATAADIQNVTAAGYVAATNRVQIEGGSPDYMDIQASKPVRYTVTGGGYLVYGESIERSKRVSTLAISSDASVWLYTNSRTNVVSAYVEGHNSVRQSAKLTVIYRFPRVRKISGDSPIQRGAHGSRLLEPFVVHVTDGGSGTGSNVPGQAVTFTSDETGSTFEAHPDFPDTATTSNIPAGSPQTTIATNSATVTTDSQGRARVFLVFSSNN